MLSRRVFIFVDGSNLYHRLQQVFHLKEDVSRFDYRRFVDSIIPANTIVSRRYYIGVFQEEFARFFKKQQRFLKFIKSDPQGFLVRGGMVRKKGDTFQEKGVDVLLAIDLVIGAARDEYDTAVMVSSDSDLVPAIEFVRSCGKQIVYVAFKSRRTIAITKLANQTKVYGQEQLAEFLRRD